MRGWLFLVVLASFATACTNDYGQFRFPPDYAGGASNEGAGTGGAGAGGAGTGGTFSPIPTAGSAGAN